MNKISDEQAHNCLLAHGHIGRFADMIAHVGLNEPLTKDAVYAYMDSIAANAQGTITPMHEPMTIGASDQKTLDWIRREIVDLKRKLFELERIERAINDLHTASDEQASETQS